MRDEFKQIESYLQIQKLLDIELPLNFTRGWAASPDYLLLILKELLKLVRNKESITILEAGSGVSTVVLGAALRKFSPQSQVFSLEHDYDFFLKTQEELNFHKINTVKLLYAPLVSYEINGNEWFWYDTSELFKYLSQKIDFLVVDGPPEATQEMARYPVIPVLREKLSDDFVLILDDAYRKGEKRAAYLWKRELQLFESKEIETEKGTLIIKSIPSTEVKSVKFSVCIPTYNRAQFLKEAIESVLSQTYSDFELVVYDDGSTDETEEVIRSFRDKRIRYYKASENRGRPYARNSCIDLSKNEWLVWLDDDDKMEPELLSHYALAINRYPKVKIFYPKYFYIKDEIRNGTANANCYDFFKNRKGVIRKLMETTPIPNPGVCVHRSLYKEFGKYNTEFLRAQDYEFWFRTLPYVDLKAVDYLGVVYRIHGKNISVDLSLADVSYESLAKRNFLNSFSLEEIYYFTNSPVKFLSRDLSIHDDLFNASYYLWYFNEEGDLFEKLLSESGLNVYRDSRLKRLYLKYLNFLTHGNYEAAEKLGEKLGRPFVLLTSGLSLLERDKEGALLRVKRAFLINPLLDLNLLDNKLRPEVEVVVKRIITPVNPMESKKNQFIRWLKGDETFCLHNS